MELVLDDATTHVFAAETLILVSPDLGVMFTLSPPSVTSNVR